MFRTSSVQTRFFIPSGVIFLALSIILILFSSYMIQKTFIDRIQLSVSDIIRTEATKFSPDDFHQTDQEYVDNLFGQLYLKVKTSEISMIRVWNDKGRVIYSDDKSITGKYPTDNQDYRAAMRGKTISFIENQNKPILAIYVPIIPTGKDSPSGVIETYFIMDYVNTQIKATQIIIITAIVSFALITYLLLIIFFKKVIQDPILKLKNAAEDIEKGTLSSRVDIRSSDEIGQLATSFNNMAKNLQNYYYKLEAKVDERTTFIRTIVDINPNLIYVKDSKGKFSFVNKAAANILGTTVADLVGKAEGQLDKNDEQVLETNKPIFIAEEPITNLKTNEIRWFQTIKAPLRDGVADHQVLSVSTDITDHKNSDQRIKELDDLKSTFIKIVSHQLRTPLSSINWNLELLLGKDLGPVTKGQEEILRTTNKANRDVILRIDDLLKALEIEEGEMKLKLETLKVDGLLSSVLQDFKSVCEVKKLSLVLEHAQSTLPQITADPGVLRDVFHKLIDNSVTYTKEGGKITLKLLQVKNMIRFETTDNGIGIPKAEQTNIFNRFQRASNAFELNPDASGLGLYIAKYEIESHGGKIGYSSADGKGSTFWFEVPVKKA